MELWEAGEGEEVVLQQVHSFTHSKKIYQALIMCQVLSLFLENSEQE